MSTPALAERLIHLGLSPDVRPYAAIQAISECFKILQQGIIDKNNRLVELDTALEDISLLISDGFTSADEDGNPLDIDHFIKQKKIEDSKSKEQKIKESWEMINNPKNALLRKALLRHLSQLPKDSSEAKNIRANLKLPEEFN